jgi:adenine-specific DNA methylase
VDSRRPLAVKGQSDSFGTAMVQAYSRLASKMPNNGIQVVMFTHQDASVWADLALILWAAGLRVTAAWCIATETTSELKEGNYVQGTVILVLRKQTSTDTAFLDEVYQEVEGEVRRQLDSMKDLDDARDPNFSDTDYQLAAYAAALRVLTSKKIEEIDVAYELTRKRGKGEKSKVEEIIEKAVKIACDHLVPAGIEPHLWKSLSSLERLYVKGLEMESHGEHRQGVYQELARGFGVEEYKHLLASTKANETRLKTATEFGRKELGDAGFGSSLVRHALFATFKTAETESTRDGITWFKTEVKDYGANRQRLIELLDYVAALGKNASLEHWHKDAHAAGLLAGALRNRQDNV